MTHYSEQDWRDYIRGETAEPLRTHMEEHLLACDACLIRYMEVIEQEQLRLPESVRDGCVADRAMQQVRSNANRSARVRQRRRFVHYVVAAAITFLLTTSGIFERMIAPEMTGPGFRHNAAPISEQVMERALSIFDRMDNDYAEGGNNR